MEASTKKRRSKRGGRRPGAGRSVDIDSPALNLDVPPALGIKDELSAVAKKRGITINDAAVAVLTFARGSYDRIVERMNVQPLTLPVTPTNGDAPAATKGG